MPWSMEMDVALLVVHLSFAEPPLVMLLGTAVSVQDGALGGGGFTVTVVWQCTVPPGPVAVPVYVVVVFGKTGRAPTATDATDPTPLSMVNEVAFAVCQESFAESPLVMVEGLMLNEHVGAFGGGGVVTVTVVWQCTVPPGPVAVPV